MDKRDLGITIGICASLVVHGFALTYSAHKFAQTSLYYPATMQRQPGVPIMLKPSLPILPPDPREDIGEATGTGDSNFASSGDRPLQAPKEDESQAWYTLEHSGQRNSPKPGQSDSAKNGDNGRGGPRARAAQELAEAIRQIEYPQQPRPPAPKPPANPIVTKPTPPTPPPPPPPFALVPSPTAHLQLPSTTQPAPPQLAMALPPPQASPVPTPPTPTPPTVRPASGDGRKPGAAASAGNPAPHSDTESDPFSKTGTVVFHNGKVDARFGRKMQVRRRPDFLDHGYWDQFTVDDPTVVLKISIDANGNVSKVPEIVKSSGSNDIDLPTQRAVLEWWFEPRLDAKGHPVPDVIIFTIKYR